MSSNPFSLYYDHPKRAEAERALTRLIDNFITDLTALQQKYEQCGAYDTDSRDTTAIYIAEKKLGLIPRELPVRDVRSVRKKSRR